MRSRSGFELFPILHPFKQHLRPAFPITPPLLRDFFPAIETAAFFSLLPPLSLFGAKRVGAVFPGQPFFFPQLSFSLPNTIISEKATPYFPASFRSLTSSPPESVAGVQHGPVIPFLQVLFSSSTGMPPSVDLFLATYPLYHQIAKTITPWSIGPLLRGGAGFASVRVPFPPFPPQTPLTRSLSQHSVPQTLVPLASYIFQKTMKGSLSSNLSSL